MCIDILFIVQHIKFQLSMLCQHAKSMTDFTEYNNISDCNLFKLRTFNTKWEENLIFVLNAILNYHSKYCNSQRCLKFFFKWCWKCYADASKMDTTVCIVWRVKAIYIYQAMTLTKGSVLWNGLPQSDNIASPTFSEKNRNPLNLSLYLHLSNMSDLILRQFKNA
jgi:hypothetical protein